MALLDIGLFFRISSIILPFILMAA